MGPVVWTEMEGRRRACQIGSVLIQYLSSLGREISSATVVQAKIVTSMLQLL